MNCEKSETTVILTGFGPFQNHLINASWETAKELERKGIEGINLITKEIPVEYETVGKVVPNLWKEYKPKLVVHCGVSGLAKTVVLEKAAHNEGYYREDVRGKTPCRNCCLNCGKKCIRSGLDLQRVCDEINNSGIGVKAILSEDAGRYLCEFTYYTSLAISSETSAFIHVPPIGNPYSLPQMAEAVKIAIKAMLKQLQDRAVA